MGREDLQPGFSTKLRGVYNRMAQLNETDARRGVVCYSIGSHAESVALSASQLGIDATVVLPSVTPFNRQSAVQRSGVKVVIHGSSTEEAKTEAIRLAEQE